ncbi:MAG TPA: S41 family peptidase [Isosphaeraceae bacterium]|nr:S41 family peptidase [Isosphaeraceae bacterium]
MPRRNLFAIVMVAAVSLLCWQTSQGARPKDKDDAMELYGLFVDAVEQVEANYVRRVDRRELLESALRGMLQNLDPHSTYINEADWKRFKRQIEGSFTGIGIQVDIDSHGRLIVIAPLLGTPAAAAGILGGDVIMEIDGKTTEGITSEKAVEVLQGRPGTSVTLKIMHKGGQKAETVTLNRALIDMPSVDGVSRGANGRWEYMLDKDRKIAYIRVHSFIQKTADELQAALEELKKAGMKALILDLRSNPGGLLTSAVEVSDLFIDAGKIVVTKGRNSPERQYDAEKDGTYTGFPMAVLINGGSASAAEIVSACLQDHKRAAIVGSRSYGKGSVQNIIDLEDGNSVLKLTVATYWRPSGKNIHRFKDAKDSDDWGVSPDAGLEVKYTPDEERAWLESRDERGFPVNPDAKPDEAEPPKADSKEKNGQEAKKPFVDRQLEKALEVIKKQLAEGKDQARK